MFHKCLLVRIFWCQPCAIDSGNCYMPISNSFDHCGFSLPSALYLIWHLPFISQSLYSEKLIQFVLFLLVSRRDIFVVIHLREDFAENWTGRANSKNGRSNLEPIKSHSYNGIMVSTNPHIGWNTTLSFSKLAFAIMLTSNLNLMANFLTSNRF